MPNYAQITDQGVVHTIMLTVNTLEGINIKEVPAYDFKYLGCLWDGTVFRKLAISCSKTELAVGETTEVNIQWVDVDDNPVNYGENVELKCGEVTEQVVMTNGKGATTFESGEPGEFWLVVVSPHGVTASIKVVVS